MSKFVECSEYAKVLKAWDADKEYCNAIRAERDELRKALMAVNSFGPMV